MLDRTAALSLALIAPLSTPAGAQVCSTEAVNVTPSGAFSTQHRYPNGLWVSPDGRWIAWADMAGDLVPGTVGPQFRPYIRDRVTGVTEHLAVLADGSTPNAGSLYFDLSPDRRWLAFSTDATNVVVGDLPGRDVFVLDRLTHTAELVNFDSAGQPGSGGDKPAISADGRFVAFTSYARLEPADQNTIQDVYLRDRLLGTTRLVSITPGGIQGNLWSDQARVSDDGRYVVWVSYASTWFPGDQEYSDDIFRRDMLLGTFELVSQNLAGQITGFPCYLNWVSDDGRYVGFTTAADAMVADEPVDGFATSDGFLRDMESGQTTLVSRAADGTLGNGNSGLLGVSDDRRYVALGTSATNILPPGSGSSHQIVRKDLVTSEIRLMSVSTTSELPNDSLGSGGALSGDGLVAAFYSRATNLVPQGGVQPGLDLFARVCPAETGTSVCFGDGTGTSCPCGNSGAIGHGCASATRPEGALIGAIGSASLANDTLILTGESTTNSIVTYFQGTGLANGGAGIVFGDGLLCVNGSVIRLGTRSASNGTSRFPGAGDPSVSVRGQVPASGAVRHYQIWYRIAAPFCTPATFSFSNAVSIAWTP